MVFCSVNIICVYVVSQISKVVIILCAGIFQSCLKKGKNDTDLSSDKLSTSNVSPFNSNRCKEFNLANYTRFSKRISVRVVLNNTNTKCDFKDIPFLEAFGITTEKSPNLKLSCKFFYSHIAILYLFYNTTLHGMFYCYINKTNIYSSGGIIDT